MNLKLAAFTPALPRLTIYSRHLYWNFLRYCSLKQIFFSSFLGSEVTLSLFVRVPPYDIKAFLTRLNIKFFLHKKWFLADLRYIWFITIIELCRVHGYMRDGGISAPPPRGANRVKRFSIAENTYTKRYCIWWSPAQNVNVERVGRISSHIAVEEKSQGHRFLKQCGKMRPTWIPIIFISTNRPFEVSFSQDKYTET